MATALNRTTIKAALKAHDDIVTFASAATLAKGHLAYIDREAMQLQMLVDPALPTIWRVMRGVSGTAAAPHAVNNQIYTGPPDAFSLVNPQGAVHPHTVINVVPLINVLTGDQFVLSSGGSWQKVGDVGVPLQPAWASGSMATYSAAGAIAIQSGSVEIVSAVARAMTLAAPTQADDGTVMTILGSGGGAHTLTTPGGFIGGGATATFAAAGGTLTIQVINGQWRVLSVAGVTFA